MAVRPDRLSARRGTRLRALHLTAAVASGIVLVVATATGDGKKGGAALAGCPGSPNCVSSQAHDRAHRVAPFRIEGDTAAAWAALEAVVASLPRTTVVSAGGGHLHAECRSLLFRFVDDLEFQLRESEGLIEVRSASRVGHSDLGVNRRRVEGVRAELVRRGVVSGV